MCIVFGIFGCLSNTIFILRCNHLWSCAPFHQERFWDVCCASSNMVLSIFSLYAFVGGVTSLFFTSKGDGWLVFPCKEIIWDWYWAGWWPSSSKSDPFLYVGPHKLLQNDPNYMRFIGVEQWCSLLLCQGFIGFSHIVLLFWSVLPSIWKTRWCMDGRGCISKPCNVSWWFICQATCCTYGLQSNSSSWWQTKPYDIPWSKLSIYN